MGNSLFLFMILMIQNMYEKKQRYQQEKQQKGRKDLQSLKYDDNPKKQPQHEHNDDETTAEQIGLMILLCFLFVLYLGVKIAFSEPGDNAQIL
mmetsp:Transcript_21856/g.24534  ORF Transcript_21856/g.24534 Transcript_21856/m.24534 type:complete len:93 (+) Transcript_21856:131-409(+)